MWDNNKKHDAYFPMILSACYSGLACAQTLAQHGLSDFLHCCYLHSNCLQHECFCVILLSTKSRDLKKRWIAASLSNTQDINGQRVGALSVTLMGKRKLWTQAPWFCNKETGRHTEALLSTQTVSSLNNVRL